MLSSPDKSQIHEIILVALEALVANARNATLLAYETATHEENIAENKYDTLGLEAAYLTQGQARRLAECEADLVVFVIMARDRLVRTIPLRWGRWSSWKMKPAMDSSCCWARRQVA